MNTRIVPPFMAESALVKVKAAERAWNCRDPEIVAHADSEDSEWRNRTGFFKGPEAIKAFLRRKWDKEQEYRLLKQLWCVTGNRISVRSEYVEAGDIAMIVTLIKPIHDIRGRMHALGDGRDSRVNGIEQTLTPDGSPSALCQTSAQCPSNLEFVSERTGKMSRLLFPPYTLDRENEQLWRLQELIYLRAKPFAVLRHLVENPRRLVTHEELRKAIWPETHVSHGVLREHLREVRAALGDNALTPRFIETVPRRGYRFLSQVDRDVSIGLSLQVMPTSPPPFVSVSSICSPTIRVRASRLSPTRSHSEPRF